MIYFTSFYDRVKKNYSDFLFRLRSNIFERRKCDRHGAYWIECGINKLSHSLFNTSLDNMSASFKCLSYG